MTINEAIRASMVEIEDRDGNTLRTIDLATLREKGFVILDCREGAKAISGLCREWGNFPRDRRVSIAAMVSMLVRELGER